MKSKESKQLQESLDKVAQALFVKLQEVQLVQPVSSSTVADEEASERGVNVAKIILGGVVTASLGYAIAHYTEENEELYAGIGALVGTLSSYIVQKRKLDSPTNHEQTSVDYKQYKREVVRDIRRTNEKVRQEWETAMQQLTENQRKQIEKMPWTDEQKELAKSNALVYKSMIISDYHYTDAIEDLEPNQDFNERINSLFTNWKVSIADIINNTKNEQWNQYFSKIYISEANQNMMS